MTDLTLTPGASDATAAEQPARYGEIFDRGYKHYDGPRLGRRHAILALIVYSIRRAVGIKKGWGSKVIPIILYVGVGLPVIVSLAIRAFIPDADVLDYDDFYSFIFIMEGIFVATIAPELLCGDRRENVLPLYFSRAITRLDYLLAKLGAAAILTLTMSFVPAAILWIGRQFLEDSPISAARRNVDDLGRIAVAGTMICFYLGALGLLISAFTGRKSIAVAIIIIGFIVSEALAGALNEALQDRRDDWVRDAARFLSPTSTTAGLVTRLFSKPDDFAVDAGLWTIMAVMAGVIVVCFGLMYWRYVPNE